MSENVDEHTQAPPKAGNDMFVLVGWTSTGLGDRLVLRMQGVNTPPPHKQEDVKVTEFYLSRNQAAQLGQYLFEATGQTAPRKRSRFSRWLEGG